ncbi:peptidoglycan DD-metalloendopeptidase family protein [Paenibacillus eucommiae]|uniref:Murein DD-endopeptidase MepM/ murein hydrolase activator NlpD n=1 Tax=Paenibacillus eucommiae TaxID=1355755 RepID=A0ABS4J497_9BACL|nr:peptidoglycan DD-metalloendopeptidase family protein [Paenibacillus eucommiae]MBP1994633.1 murein DD-endopeptidase MepM/ murein hydrolase activator NlpD [Paenibacillus eucommiae]
MTGFRGIRWVKALFKGLTTKRESLTELNSDKQKSSTMTTTTLTAINQHKWRLLYGASALTLVGAIVLSGNQYVASNMVEGYHVKLYDQEIGVVSSQQLIEEYKSSRPLEIQEQNPDVHMELNTDGVSTEPEVAYMLETDDAGVIAKLNELLVPQALGVELRVDEKVVAVVKDQAAADQILQQIRDPFTPKEKVTGKVNALSAANAGMTDIGSAPSELEKVDFVEKVETEEVPIDPDVLEDPKAVVKRLQTGGMQPTKYKVVEGDCVSCIAQKFGTSTKFIHENNPGIEDDKLKIGQEIDLTVLKPVISVKTLERVVQNHEIQFDTEYIQDDSLRVGIIQPVSAGKNGMKKVTIQVTKVNGQLLSEELVSEDLIEAPVVAKARRGTKVVLGEGTGKFSWPVISPNISSTFGQRWGRLHKGIDITGNKNIQSADNGKVVETGYKSDYGNYIIIDHMNGYETLYGHLSKIISSKGDIVEKGEKIGVMGSTGDSTGVHLHFEIHKKGSLENPLKYLSR